MRRLIPALCVLLGVAPALAQEALYGAQPPPGSAFVRFVNATDAAIDLRPSFLAASSLGTAGPARVSAYAVVERVAGRSLPLEMRSAGHAGQATLTVPPDSFNTVLVRDDAGKLSAAVVKDGAEFNQARARLSFYNATPACPAAGLALVPAGTAVFADVAAGGGRTRSVNPVKAMVHASCTGRAADDIMLDNMEVGGSYSVWLMLPGGRPATFITRDTTLPYKP